MTYNIKFITYYTLYKSSINTEMSFLCSKYNYCLSNIHRNKYKPCSLRQHNVSFINSCYLSFIIGINL